MRHIIKFLLITFFLFNIASYADEINAFSFTFPGSETDEITMSDYEGKAVLLFASSTDCGFKTQYKDFQKVYEKYKDNLVVIGISSNDLNVKEPLKGSAINKFCSDRFGTTYPISDIVKINAGSRTQHDFFIWAKSNGVQIKKNFEKILIDQNGNILKKFSRETKPTSGKIRKEIEKII